MINGENVTREDIADINNKIIEVNKKLEKLLYIE